MYLPKLEHANYTVLNDLLSEGVELYADNPTHHVLPVETQSGVVEGIAYQCQEKGPYALQREAISLAQGLTKLGFECELRNRPDGFNKTYVAVHAPSKEEKAWLMANLIASHAIDRTFINTHGFDDLAKQIDALHVRLTGEKPDPNPRAGIMLKLVRNYEENVLHRESRADQIECITARDRPETASGTPSLVLYHPDQAYLQEIYEFLRTKVGLPIVACEQPIEQLGRNLHNPETFGDTEHDTRVVIANTTFDDLELLLEALSRPSEADLLSKHCVAMAALNTIPPIPSFKPYDHGAYLYHQKQSENGYGVAVNFYNENEILMSMLLGEEYASDDMVTISGEGKPEIDKKAIEEADALLRPNLEKKLGKKETDELKPHKMPERDMSAAERFRAGISKKLDRDVSFQSNRIRNAQASMLCFGINEFWANAQDIAVEANKAAEVKNLKMPGWQQGELN